MIDKLNSFLRSLLFIEYRLTERASSDLDEKMSKYFDNKHWVFVFCCMSEVAKLLDTKKNRDFYLVSPLISSIVDLVAKSMDRFNQTPS